MSDDSKKGIPLYSTDNIKLPPLRTVPYDKRPTSELKLHDVATEVKRMKRKPIVTAVGIAAVITALGGAVAAVKGTNDNGNDIGAVQARFDERLKTETSALRKVEAHVDEHDKMIHRIDKRTAVMRAEQKLMLDALRVPASKRSQDVEEE